MPKSAETKERGSAIKKELAAKIKQRRIELGYKTVDEFASAKKLSASNVRKWESCESAISLPNLVSLAKALDCTTDYLLGLDEYIDHNSSVLFDSLGLSKQSLLSLSDYNKQSIDFTDYVLLSDNDELKSELIEANSSLQNPLLKYFDSVIAYPFEEDLIFTFAKKQNKLDKLCDKLHKRKINKEFTTAAVNYLNMHATSIDDDVTDYDYHQFIELFEVALARDDQNRPPSEEELELLYDCFSLSKKLNMLQYAAQKNFETRLTTFVIKEKKYFDNYFSQQKKIDSIKKGIKEKLENLSAEAKKIILETTPEEIEHLLILLQALNNANSDSKSDRLLALKQADLLDEGNKVISELHSNGYMDMSKDELYQEIEKLKYYYSIRKKVERKEVVL